MELQKERAKEPLYEELAAYGQSDFYPYHMPGHKRSHNVGGMSDFYSIDITEIDGFDNLHQAKGLLKQAQERAAELYGSEETFFLVNGSTCGILAAISAVTDRQDTILIARNCNKAVYHAALLQELHLRYLYPGQIAEYGIWDAINPAEIETALESYPECVAVVITSPSYEGIISDIEKISRIVHEKGRILIVDEAHGAHLGLAQGFPENAVRLGADIVIHSLHKTLPSMTQTALLHVNGPYVNRRKLRRYLSVYQSSSPSYVLMASMDACISYMKENAAACFNKMKQYYGHFIEKTDKCRYIQIGSPKTLQNNSYQFTAWDIGKLVISVKSVKGTKVTGQWLYDILRDEFHLQMEMAAGSYVLAIMTIADEEEGWQRLADALLRIDGRIEEEKDKTQDGIKDDATEEGSIQENGIVNQEKIGSELQQPIVKLTIAEAFRKADSEERNGSADKSAGGVGREVPLLQAAGEIAGDFINLYPPGVPLLVPGEVIDADIIRQIQEYRSMGLHVQGVSDAGYVIIC